MNESGEFIIKTTNKRQSGINSDLPAAAVYK